MDIRTARTPQCRDAFRVDHGYGVHNAFVRIALECRLAPREQALCQNATATGLDADVTFEEGIQGPEEGFRERSPRSQ